MHAYRARRDVAVYFIGQCVVAYAIPLDSRRTQTDERPPAQQPGRRATAVSTSTATSNALHETAPEVRQSGSRHASLCANLDRRDAAADLFPGPGDPGPKTWVGIVYLTNPRQRS
jgi:hypothetical protein